MIASGLSRIVKYKQLVGKKANGDSGQISVNENVDRRADLPPARTEFVGKKKRNYQTSDLETEPPSVVENTTRHLEVDPESEIMTLPEDKI